MRQIFMGNLHSAVARKFGSIVTSLSTTASKACLPSLADTTSEKTCLTRGSLTPLIKDHTPQFPR